MTGSDQQCQGRERRTRGGPALLTTLGGHEVLGQKKGSRGQRLTSASAQRSEPAPRVPIRPSRCATSDTDARSHAAHRGHGQLPRGMVLRHHCRCARKATKQCQCKHGSWLLRASARRAQQLRTKQETPSGDAQLPARGWGWGLSTGQRRTTVLGNVFIFVLGKERVPFTVVNMQIQIPAPRSCPHEEPKTGGLGQQKPTSSGF